MGAATRHHNAPDLACANKARLAPALINPVFQLEKAPHAFRIHVIGDRRAAQTNRILKYALKRLPEPFQFAASEPARALPGPDAGAEQAFVGVDIPDSG